jgi:hypothetical protein
MWQVCPNLFRFQPKQSEKNPIPKSILLAVAWIMNYDDPKRSYGCSGVGCFLGRRTLPRIRMDFLFRDFRPERNNPTNSKRIGLTQLNKGEGPPKFPEVRKA